jgi:hypothetical protein
MTFKLLILLALTCVMGVYSFQKKFAVAAYLPEWRYGGANFEKICKTVTHLIFFSVEPTPNGDITGLDRFPPPDVLEDARNKGCELIICFGGNGRSCKHVKSCSYVFSDTIHAPCIVFHSQLDFLQ